MVRLGVSLAAASTGAAAAALALLGGAWAACIVPGDLEQEGIDCLRFDPSTPTTVTTYYEDVKLIPGPGYLQLSLQSTPGGSYPLTNIEYKGASYVAFSPSSSTTSLFPDTTYTDIQQVTVTLPSYIRFTIPAGAVPYYGAIVQVVFTVNRDGAASAPTPEAPDGVLLDITGNNYFSATRITRTLAPTRPPTRAPTRRPTNVRTESDATCASLRTKPMLI